VTTPSDHNSSTDSDDSTQVKIAPAMSAGQQRSRRRQGSSTPTRKARWSCSVRGTTVLSACRGILKL